MFDFTKIISSIPFLLQGTFVTLQYASISVLCGFVLGVLIAFFKVSPYRALGSFARLYTSLFRGTPLLLQLTLIYFGAPQLFDYKITAFEAGVLAFSLNSAAYISEIIRAGIGAVDRGQFEAAQALGLSYSRTMLYIILPQAFRNILPALMNEMVDLIKESSLVSVIGEMDLLRRANIVAAEKFIYFEPLIFIAVIYYILVMSLSKCASLLEKRLSLR
jgi:His/Glu/Gln/Arg/opine family amino acid ABC transporter permease subunit